MIRTRRTIEGAEDEDEERGALLCVRYLGDTNAIFFGGGFGGFGGKAGSGE